MSNDQLSQLLGDMATEGWGAFEGLGDRMQGDLERLAEQQVQEANVVAAALNNPAGRKLVEWLVRRTLLRPPSVEEDGAASAPGPDAAARYALLKAERTGQNKLVFTILHALDVAAGNKPAEGVSE